ncbi:MAG TPA: ABC transporter permease, partial [Xanthobacteraceae bacterium]|nr:ABC transporter permease [Xanthobacteraceae bacterium]
MSLGAATHDATAALPRLPAITGSIASAARSVGYALVGVALLLLVWWIGGWIVASNPSTANFAGFAPAPTLARL